MDPLAETIDRYVTLLCNRDKTSIWGLLGENSYKLGLYQSILENIITYLDKDHYDKIERVFNNLMNDLKEEQ